MVLACRASYDKKTLARQVIPLAPGYRTALSSHPEGDFFLKHYLKIVATIMVIACTIIQILPTKFKAT